jgi:hypothetical protein
MEFFAGSPSPLSADEIDSLGPEGLIEWVTNWEPGDGFRSATPEMLGRTIAEAVSRGVAKWIADLQSTIGGLKEPVYIRGVFAGLTEAAKGSHLAARDLEPIVAAAELVWTEPWQSALDLQDMFDFDPDWSRAKEQVVDLVAELARKDAGLSPYVDRLGVMIQEACADTGSVIGVTPADPFTAALNKANTRAIRALIDLTLYAYRHEQGDVWTQRLFDIIEAQLDSEVEENALAVAGLTAVLWTQLSVLDETRAAGLRVLAFGRPNAEELKISVLESSIKYARPTKRLLADLRSHLLVYLGHVGLDSDERGEGKAITWLLLGHLWEVEGWLNLDELLVFLIEIEQLSQAAADYGRILKNTDPLPHNVQLHAIEFWKAALNCATDPDEYRGFGWWSEAAIPDEEWLSLIHRTLGFSKGRIDWFDGLIDRLLRLVHDLRALEVLALALTGVDRDPWTVRLAAKDIRALLEAAQDEFLESPVFQRIVELLLERELYQFREFLISGDTTEG